MPGDGRFPSAYELEERMRRASELEAGDAQRTAGECRARAIKLMTQAEDRDGMKALELIAEAQVWATLALSAPESRMWDRP